MRCCNKARPIFHSIIYFVTMDIFHFPLNLFKQEFAFSDIRKGFIQNALKQKVLQERGGSTFNFSAAGSVSFMEKPYLSCPSNWKLDPWKVWRKGGSGETSLLPTTP